MSNKRRNLVLGREARLERARKAWRPKREASVDGLVTSDLVGLSSPVCKNIPLNPSGKSILQLRPSRPNEGRWPSSRTLGGMRWTRQFRKTSEADADGEAVWS